MNNLVFKACAVTNEFDLNKIAIANNIPKKYTWEEPLFIENRLFESILHQKPSENQKILVFSFGSIVFINISSQNITAFLKYIKTFKPDIDLNQYNKYSDDYELRVTENKPIILTDEYVTVPKLEPFHLELISTVIAKSVALEKTEEQLEKILNKLENIIDKLEEGDFRIGNKQLARTSATIIRHEYNTIAYIMILDKPDITWQSSVAAEFYDNMAEFFELNDRFEILKSKTDILNTIMEGFSSISYSIRGLFLEMVVIILIILEVILMIIDLFK